MYTMMLFSLVLVLPGVLGSKCCMSRQWEGIEAQVIGNAPKRGEATVSETEIKVHYDITNNRLAFEEKVTSKSTTVNVKVIQIWDQMTEYIIQEDGSCIRKQLTGNITDGCVPDSAVSMGTHYEGSHGNRVHYNSYRMNDLVKGFVIFADFTTDTCQPIRQVTYGSTPTTSILVSNRYYDITDGIKDTSVFKIPSSCKNAPFKGTFPAHHGGALNIGR